MIEGGKELVKKSGECLWVKGGDFARGGSVYTETVEAGEFLIAPVAVNRKDDETEVNSQLPHFLKNGECLDIIRSSGIVHETRNTNVRVVLRKHCWAVRLFG